MSHCTKAEVNGKAPNALSLSRSTGHKNNAIKEVIAVLCLPTKHFSTDSKKKILICRTEEVGKTKIKEMM